MASFQKYVVFSFLSLCRSKSEMLQTIYQDAVSKLSSSFDCLISLDASALQGVNVVVCNSTFYGTTAFTPVIDGEFIVERAFDTIRRRKLNGASPISYVLWANMHVIDAVCTFEESFAILRKLIWRKMFRTALLRLKWLFRNIWKSYSPHSKFPATELYTCLGLSILNEKEGVLLSRISNIWIGRSFLPKLFSSELVSSWSHFQGAPNLFSA